MPCQLLRQAQVVGVVVASRPGAHERDRAQGPSPSHQRDADPRPDIDRFEQGLEAVGVVDVRGQQLRAGLADQRGLPRPDDLGDAHLRLRDHAEALDLPSDGGDGAALLGHGQPPDGAVRLEPVHDAPLGEVGDGQPGQRLQRSRVIEGSRQEPAGLRQEPQALLCQFALRDVASHRGGADDLPRRVADGGHRDLHVDDLSVLAPAKRLLVDHLARAQPHCDDVADRMRIQIA